MTAWQHCHHRRDSRVPDSGPCAMALALARVMRATDSAIPVPLSAPRVCPLAPCRWRSGVASSG